MQLANRRRETLTPRTGVDAEVRPEDTAGGRVAPTQTRRDILKWGLFGSLLLMLGGFVQAFLMFFYPKKVGTFGGKVTMPESIDTYRAAGMTRVREGKFFLAHLTQADGAEGFIALYWKCAHLGCTVPWKPDEAYQGNAGIFRCPCHGSIYLKNGQNVAGPAPRPLDTMAIEVTGGKIVVNTGKITQRVRFQPSDVTKV